MDIAAAQDAFARGGSLSRIDLRVRPGVDSVALRARLANALPAGLTVTTPQDNAAVTLRMSRAYRVNLNVLALVALFTGGLLVFSTQTLSVVRRRAHLALLRTLGLTRARLVMLLIGEGALIGVAGSLLGLACGYVLANVVLEIFGADLGAGFFRGVVPHASFDPAAALVFGGLGIAVAMLGSFIPAREAGRATPAAALKAGDEQQPGTRSRPARGRRTVHAGAADCGLAALRLFRDRAAAHRDAAVGAEAHRTGSRGRARAEGCPRRARARPVARRTGPGHG
jgi:putative ABC transport system permease protein